MCPNARARPILSNTTRKTNDHRLAPCEPPPTRPPVSTFIFDAEGTPCVTFDAKPHLGGPLTAFVAGDLTSSAGTTGPSLVYLDTSGKVVAYHGLLEQVNNEAPGVTVLCEVGGRSERLAHPQSCGLSRGWELVLLLFIGTAVYFQPLFSCVSLVENALAFTT